VGVSSSPSIVHCLITWPSNSAKPGSRLEPGQSPGSLKWLKASDTA
jgi:hypothetical protein